MEANQLFLDLVNFKKVLIKEFIRECDVKDTHFLLDSPWHGSLNILDKEWHYKKHGSGIAFTRVKDQMLIDIPGGFNDPDASTIDIVTIIEYCISIKSTTLTFNEKKFNVSDSGLKELFEKLSKAGIITMSGSQIKLLN